MFRKSTRRCHCRSQPTWSLLFLFRLYTPWFWFVFEPKELFECQTDLRNVFFAKTDPRVVFLRQFGTFASLERILAACEFPGFCSAQLQISANVSTFLKDRPPRPSQLSRPFLEAYRGSLVVLTTFFDNHRVDARSRIRRAVLWVYGLHEKPCS